MKSLKEVSLGFLSAIASTVIIMGAILVAMTEGIGLSVPTIEPTNTLPAIVNTLIPGVSSPTALTSPTQKRPVVVTITATPKCTPPANWVQYQVKSGDKVSKLAESLGVSVQTLWEGNCLPRVDSLSVDSFLYLPPTPTPTFTITVTFTVTNTLRPSATIRPSVTTCSPPANWVKYTVQHGDTLFALSQAVGLSDWHILMTANCLTSININTGDTLYLPRLPSRTPTATATSAPPPPPPPPTPTPTRIISRTPTATLTQPPPPTPTGTPTQTEVPSPTPTDTLEPSPTPTTTLEPPPPPPE